MRFRTFSVLAIALAALPFLGANVEARGCRGHFRRGCVSSGCTMQACVPQTCQACTACTPAPAPACPACQGGTCPIPQPLPGVTVKSVNQLPPATLKGLQDSGWPNPVAPPVPPAPVPEAPIAPKAPPRFGVDASEGGATVERVVQLYGKATGEEPPVETPPTQAPTPNTQPVPYTVPSGGGVQPIAVPVNPSPTPLDEVNALRAAKGLRPYIEDPALTQAAQRTAQYRADRLMFHHTHNDWAVGGIAPTPTSAAGCAAYPPAYGFMACAIFDDFTYAGAAAVIGRDGRRFCHLFVRK